MSEKSLGQRIATSAAVLGASASLSAANAPEVFASQAHSISSVESVDKYIHSAGRAHRIQAALTKFAIIVVNQERTKGKWAPFDAYCSPKNINSNGGDGWISQGFRPTKNDDCDLQHNPEYGGLNIAVGADMGILPDGRYNPNNVVGSYALNAGNCKVSFNYLGKVFGWDTIVGGPKLTAKNDTQMAEAAGYLKVAERIDNLGLACLQKAEAALNLTDSTV